MLRAGTRRRTGFTTFTGTGNGASCRGMIDRVSTTVRGDGPVLCGCAYFHRIFRKNVRFNAPCLVLSGLGSTVGGGSGRTVGGGVRALGGMCTSVRGGSCSRRMSHGITRTLLPLCTRVIPTSTLPTFCAAVRGSFGNGCSTCMSRYCSGSVFSGRTGFGGFVGGPAIGTVRGSPVATCMQTGCSLVSGLKGRLTRSVGNVSLLRGACMHNLYRVCSPRPGTPSTGFAVHLACNGIGSCGPGSNMRCGCCAALGNIVRGRSPAGPRFIIPTGLGRLCRAGSFKHCTLPGNSVPTYFLAAGSVANNGSNSPIVGNGNRLVNTTFSNG